MEFSLVFSFIIIIIIIIINFAIYVRSKINVDFFCSLHVCYEVSGCWIYKFGNAASFNSSYLIVCKTGRITEKSDQNYKVLTNIMDKRCGFNMCFPMVAIVPWKGTSVCYLSLLS
jgi:hypothetical protein